MDGQPKGHNKKQQNNNNKKTQNIPEKRCQRNVAALLSIWAKTWKAQCKRKLFSPLLRIEQKRKIEQHALQTKRTGSRCARCVHALCPTQVPALEVSCLFINRTLVQGLPTAFGKGVRAKRLGPPGLWNSSQKIHLHAALFLNGLKKKRFSRPHSTIISIRF